MKTGRIVLIAILVIVAMIAFGSCGRYNTMVQKRNKVDTQWSQVENDYQTRGEKIRQLVDVVKGQANFEQGTLAEIVTARSQAMQVMTNIDASNLTPENMAKFQQAQDGLTRALSGGIRLINENYPTLQANAGFQNLAAEISEIENRINISRKDFNASVQDYNNEIQTFPNTIYAGIFGFKSRPLFQASAGMESAPNIDFGNFRNNGNNNNGSNNNSGNNGNNNGGGYNGNNNNSNGSNMPQNQNQNNGNGNK